MSHFPYCIEPEYSPYPGRYYVGNWLYSGTGYSSPIPSGREPWRAFDGEPGTYTNVGYDGYGWGTLTIADTEDEDNKHYLLSHYTIQARADTAFRAPPNWYIVTYDGTAHVSDERSAQSWTAGEIKTFYFDEPVWSSRLEWHNDYIPSNGYEIALITVYYTRAARNIWVYKSGVWESVTDIWAYKSGAWQPVSSVDVNKDGWKPI